MNLEYYFNDFINYLKAEKDVSHYTVDNYTSDFKQFLNFLRVNGIQPKLNTVTTPIIRRYLAHLKTEKNYAVETIRRRIHCLSSYFKFLLEQEYIIKNPMAAIHAPKSPETVPRFLSMEEIQLLLEMPQKHSPDNALRNLCMMEGFLMTGVRRQELLDLNWDDIDFGEKTITVRNGKGKKQRVIPITEPLISHLWKYLQSRLPLTNHALFISANGGRLSCTPLEQTFRLYMKKSGLDKKGYTLHTLRHTYASHLALNGASILSIQKLLGHSDLNSTQIYAHINTDHLRSEVEKLPLVTK